MGQAQRSRFIVSDTGDLCVWAQGNMWNISWIRDSTVGDALNGVRSRWESCFHVHKGSCRGGWHDDWHAGGMGKMPPLFGSSRELLRELNRISCCYKRSLELWVLFYWCSSRDSVGQCDPIEDARLAKYLVARNTRDPQYVVMGPFLVYGSPRVSALM